MKETIQMANNCLYSLPCLNNENDVCYDLKQNLYYGRAIKKKKKAFTWEQNNPDLAGGNFC